MADRDTSGIGGPNSKPSEPLGRQQDSIGNRDDAIKNDMDDMREQAMESGRETLGTARGRIRSLMEQQSHRAADQLGSVVDALHAAADQLAKENNRTAARYADQAAGRVAQVADVLRNSTMDDMVGHVERFARRQPEVFIGAAFAAGFLFSRFVKSSGERRFQDSRHTPAQTVRNGGYGRHDYDEAGARAFATGTRQRGTGTGSAAGGPAMSAGVAASRGTGTLGTADTGLNSATSATAAARARDAAGLMAGTSPAPNVAGAAGPSETTKPRGTTP